MDDSIEEYQSSLEDLTFNSKPHINMLTILADENKSNAENIVKLIEAQLYKAAAKLPILYLLDSIVKNVGENYNPLFAKNIVNTFRQAFQTGNEKQKMSLYKLRTTWDEHFPLKKLHALDLKIHTLDPNWPVKPLPAHLQDGATNIHVNPKFIKRNEPVAKPVNPVVPAKAQAKTNDVDKIREQMIRQQKELLDLQQRKLMLELEQTKQELEAKQKEMHVQVGKHEKVARDPRLKSSHAPKVPAGGLRVTVKNKPSGPPVREKQSAREPKVKTNGEHTQKVQVKPGRPSPSFPNKQEAAKIKASLNVPKKRSPKIAPKKIKKSISPALDRPGSRLEMHSIQKPVPKTVEPKPKASIKETKKLVQPSDEHPLEKLLPVPNEQRDAERRKKRTYRNKPRSPSPPPPKLARRSSSPAPIRQISPDASVRRDPRQFGNENRRIRAMKDTQTRDSSRSSEGSLSPRFSPEPEANDPSKPSSQWKPPPKRIRQQNDEPRNPPMRLNTESKLEIPQELTLSHQNEILRQADRQLQSGQLSHEQHQELLKQLHQLFELQRIRKIQFEEDDDHRRKDNNLNRRGFVPVHPQRGGRRPIHPRNMAEDDPRFRDRPHGPPMHNNRRLPPDHHFGRGRGLPGRGRPFRNHSPQSPRKNGGPINDPRIRREERPKFAQNEEFPPHHFNRSPMRAEERREHHRSLSPHRSAGPADEAQKRQSDDHHKNLRKYAHSDQN
uniref:CID domain-containing protein n=1 Tax=Ciona savignyi TaxID=51511 RepID=H2Z7V7_CIOSA